MVGIDGMTKAEGVGEQGCSEKNGMVAECDQRPDPCQCICCERHNADSSNLASRVFLLVVKKAANPPRHGRMYRCVPNISGPFLCAVGIICRLSASGPGAQRLAGWAGVEAEHRQQRILHCRSRGRQRSL